MNSHPMHVHHPSDLSNDAIADKVDAAVQALMEHFGAVQILASFEDDQGQTINVYSGGGNWFARQGMAHDFIQKDQAHTNGSEIARALPSTPPDDDGESWRQS